MDYEELRGAGGAVKLNGWKRIGIVASVAWILCAGIHTYDSETDRDSDFIVSSHVKCDGDLAGLTGGAWQKGFDECNRIADDSLALAISNDRFNAALVAFIPVPLGWGLVYSALFLVRWVKRGFIGPH